MQGPTDARVVFLLVTGTGLSVLLLTARLADEVRSGHLHRSLLLMLNR